MWLSLKVRILLLVGVFAASSVCPWSVSPSAMLAGGALVLYRPNVGFDPSAPLFSSLSLRQRDSALGAPRMPTTAWWLGMGFSSGLLIAALSLSLLKGLSGASQSFAALGLMPTGMADVRFKAYVDDLHTAFLQGDHSPDGVAVVGVGPRQAFERADAVLARPVVAQADWLEARFWLKHGLTGTHDRDTLAWAFVQLGSSYVYASDGPDYVTAHRFWQIAGLLGDRVALCFEAQALHLGLTGVRDNAEAQLLYSQTGGPTECRTRVTQAR
jgi:hypothetical protein